MQIATAALKQTPAIRADKVAELKARITPGTYQVPGEAIAERMLTDDLLD
jgi:flagellar biosynthesis anti-sigma factor FlgM